MFPIYLKGKEFQEPEDPIYYLIAGNGIFLVKRMGLYSAATKVDGIAPVLSPHSEQLALRIPKIPRLLVRAILGFFRAAFRWHGGEAIVFLYYSEKKASFCVRVPPQRVHRRVYGHRTYTDGHVDYDTCPRPDGFVKLGTLHSHADMLAFHSHTDHCDERYEDGLHITIGRIDTKRPDISASFVVNGVRFKVHPIDVLEDSAGVPLEPPPSWMLKITCIDRCDGMIIRRNLRYETACNQDKNRPHKGKVV